MDTVKFRDSMAFITLFYVVHKASTTNHVIRPYQIYREIPRPSIRLFPSCECRASLMHLIHYEKHPSSRSHASQWGQAALFEVSTPV